MASKAHLTFNSTAYNRRDSFGLGWADQWDYKFNDEKLLKSNSCSSCNKMANPSSSSSSSSSSSLSSSSTTTGLFTSKLGIGNIGTKSSSSSLLRAAKFGKENRSSNSSSSSSSSSSLVHKSPLGSSKKLADINKKVTSAANSSAHKVKSSTHMGIKWLKKQCSLKTLKSSDHSA